MVSITEIIRLITDISVNNDVVEYISDSDILVNLISERRENLTNTFQGSFSAIWDLDKWSIKALAAYASIPQDADMFRYFADTRTAGSYDVRQNSRYWDVQTGIDIGNISEFNVTQARRWFFDNDDSEYSSQIDVKRELGNLFRSLEFGLKYRDRLKERTYSFSRIRGFSDPFSPVATRVRTNTGRLFTKYIT